MDSKKKMIIAISAFAVVLLATVVAVVAVLAANQVSVSSSIKVTYNASEIAGKVTAQYQVAGGSLTDIGDGSIEYTGTESDGATTSLTASTQTISGLTKDNNYVDFVFTFTNTGSSAYTATLTLPATINNFTISYTVPSGVTKISDTSFTVAAGTTTPVTYNVRFTITKVANDADIDGTFSWTLA